MTRHQNFPLDIGWRALLQDLGVNAQRLLRRANLPLDLFARAQPGLGTADYFRFWRSLEAEVGDPLFPLRLVEQVTAETFDPPILAALCSANLTQAAHRLAQYKELMVPMTLEVVVDTRGALHLTPHWRHGPGEPVPPSLQVAELAFLVRLARLATRTPLSAQRVVLSVLPQPEHAQRYEAYFGVAVRRGAQPGIVFSAADAQRPFLTGSDALWRVFEPVLGRRLSELQRGASTTERVRALLPELLPGNTATIETVAERLAISPRTLQRRLGDEGETFRRLLNGTREHMARHYLTQTRLSGGEIAYLLGFEDPNSFYRAFHEWTGQTPDTVRQAPPATPPPSDRPSGRRDGRRRARIPQRRD